MNSILTGTNSFNTPKPSKLIERIVKIIADDDSIILDSFAGSGTTANAVLNLNELDSGNRKFILIEMEDYAETITAERIKRIISGYPDKVGVNRSFDYYQLGQPLFKENGELNEHIEIEKLRSYVYYTETAQPLRQKQHIDNIYFLDIYNQTCYYFYYEAEQLTTLNDEFLSSIKTKAEEYIIYADNCLLNAEYMKKNNIMFKKIPRDISKF